MKNLVLTKRTVIEFLALIGIVFSFFVTPAQASSFNVPQDARRIDQILTSTNSTDRSQIVIAGDTSTLAYEKSNSDQLNIQCREIIFEWFSTTSKVCVWKDSHQTDEIDSSGYLRSTRVIPYNQKNSNSYSKACGSAWDRRFWGLELIDATNLTINIYCAPRSESQKFIMSVKLACEKNPTVECVKLAPQFDLIAPTTSRNIDRP